MYSHQNVHVLHSKAIHEIWGRNKNTPNEKKVYIGKGCIKKCVLEIMYNSGKIISFITGIFAIFYSLIPRKIVIYVASVIFMLT